ncbi:VOC family protein [Dictyobacter arantiisoli]|uniref:3,4-dihydroxyphenylacetate 2,3-dioxygenase n=1 Tax=Dictyobacter arantiisoli TaxID=2014874 RepID=A0A5A5T8P0_9CHLR|nr:VOC family protein [Dictyobacter arantiisoli]GCF07413.1 3,4-dihydroxyphenylacetate 2,3-dioxygenase [Dictyobacter arantiisoli]
MSNQQIQKVKVKRLAHVGLWTTDVSAQAHFYHQVLGLDARAAVGNVDDDEANIFLALDEVSHSVGLFEDTRLVATNGRRPVQRSPLHHLSFEVDSDAELAALAARLKMAGIDLMLEARDGDPDMGDTLWFNDPDGNRIEISARADDLLITPRGRRSLWHPQTLQHIALYTPHLEAMVEFYTEALGFDISDWLLRERAWLRCNQNHHTIMFIQGQAGIDHLGFGIADGPELFHWADHLSQHQVPLVWGPGRHGASGDLFLRFADPDGIHVELSAGIQQYYDHDVTAPPRLWHTRATALNLWGPLPAWIREGVQV